MHNQAMDFVRGCVIVLPIRRAVVEFGSYDVNGSVRNLFTGADYYLGVDSRPGPGVNVVCDAARWAYDRPYDTVICTEVLEHASNPQAICVCAYDTLISGGVFIVTAATTGREPHSIDGKELGPDEYYGNISSEALKEWLSIFRLAIVKVRDCDVYALAVK